jgi:hypothetical protein
MKPEDEKIIRRYLLQELDEEERQGVEKRLMTDDDFFRHICVAESEIAEEYARGALAGEERESFERSFLSTPEGRQQVSFNLALRRYISEEENDPHESPSLLSSLAAFWRSQKTAAALALALAMMLVAASSWLIIRERRRQSELDRLEAQAREVNEQLAAARERGFLLEKDYESIQERNADLERQLAELRNKPGGAESGSLISAILSVPLTGGVTRASDSQEVKITADKKTVELKLRVSSGFYRSYSAEIKQPDGKSINRTRLASRVEQRETRVILRLAASEITQGDYTITLFGIAEGKTERVETYRFTAVKD